MVRIVRIETDGVYVGLRYTGVLEDDLRGSARTLATLMVCGYSVPVRSDSYPAHDNPGNRLYLPRVLYDSDENMFGRNLSNDYATALREEFNRWAEAYDGVRTDKPKRRRSVFK